MYLQCGTFINKLVGAVGSVDIYDDKPDMNLLAGYISGASVDLARVRAKGESLELYDKESYPSRDFSDLESVLRNYLKRHAGVTTNACFGVAGPVIGNDASTPNLKWHIAGEKLRESFSMKTVRLLNNVVATAHGLPHLSPDKFYTINKGHPVEGGNVGLISAGTGLGEALLFWDGDRRHPYASEGGHADFAPGSQLEAELWEYLYADKGQVEVEDVVSRSGLERIYQFLVDTNSIVTPEWFHEAKDCSAAIIEKALSGEDETASRAVDLFIDCYAAEAGNLALKGMTLGGIYIGGSIAPQILTLLDGGRFMQRFVKRGKMEELLSRMPVSVIIEDKAALIGAAGVALTM